MLLLESVAINPNNNNSQVGSSLVEQEIEISNNNPNQLLSQRTDGTNGTKVTFRPTRENNIKEEKHHQPFDKSSSNGSIDKNQKSEDIVLSTSN